MNHMLVRSPLLVLLLSAGLALWGCAVDEPVEVWNPAAPAGPDPVITSISPTSKAFSGITDIRISGQNFSTTDSLNFVFFDKIQVKVKQATSTSLLVAAPQYTSNTITIKVAVPGAIKVATFSPYTLEEAATEYGGFLSVDEVYSVAVDRSENLFAELKGASTGVIYKVTPTGVKTEYSTLTIPKASEIRVGPGGYLYCQQSNNFNLFRVPSGGGNPELFVRLDVRARTFDFDSLGTIYSAGAYYGLAATSSSSGTTREVGNFTPYDIRSIRVYNGYVYFLAVRDGVVAGLPPRGVYRARITSATGELGPVESVFDITKVTAYATSELLALAISSDGELYIGTDHTNPILVVAPSGSSAPLYPGVLVPPAGQIVWGTSQQIYVNRSSGDPMVRRVIRVAVGKNGAPDYGRR